MDKIALGGEEIVALLKQLKARGYVGVAVEQTAKPLPYRSRPSSDQKYGLVLDYEVLGVSKAALLACDLALEIPQYSV